MAQYRSQWTGEVIDDAVGKAKHITYLDVRNESAESAYAKAEAAQGIAELVAVYKFDDGLHQQYYYMPCVYRYNQGSEADYHFMANYSNNRIASVRLFNSWAGPMWSSFTISAVDSTPTEGSNNLVTSGGVKSAIDKVAIRPNLLRNSYFVGGGSQQGGGQFPINQRGQTTYSGAVYGVDGWRNYQPAVTTTITSAGLSITRSSGDFYSLVQTVDNVSALAGKKVTASMLATGYNRVRLVADGTSILDSGDGNVTKEFNSATVTLPSNLSTLLFIAYTSTNVATVVKAVKLELGDTQTLCHNEGTAANPVWVLNEIPDYATELAKCQRYLYVINFPTYAAVGFGTAASAAFFRGLIPTPVTMRAHPTITYTTSDIRLVGNGGTISLVGKTFGTDQIFPNGAPFYCNGLTGMTTSALYVLEAYNGSIILSAET